MEQKSMTALVSAFARAYHSQNNTVTIFNDSLARQLLGEEQYAGIAKSMEEGISFFNPSFTGTKEEALRWIVDSQLSPSPLGRAAFAEKSLECAVFLGARQYLILGKIAADFRDRSSCRGKGQKRPVGGVRNLRP